MTPHQNTTMSTTATTSAEQNARETFVSLGSFQDITTTKVLRVYNLGKAGALVIGNVLCHYDRKMYGEDPSVTMTNAEDVVESMTLGISRPFSPYELELLQQQTHFLQVKNFIIEVEKKPAVTQQEVTIVLHVKEFVISEENNQEPITIALRNHDKFTVSFKVNTQFKIRRLQMYFKRCIFKMRCHRRRMLLLACMISHPRIGADSKGNSGLTLASLFNDPFGGIMRQFVAPLVVG